MKIALALMLTLAAVATNILLTEEPADGSQQTGSAGDKVRAHAEASTALEFLQIAYGLTAEEAQVRLLRQQEAQELSNALQRALTESYAGGWIDNAEGGRVHFRFKGGLPSLGEQLISASSIKEFIDIVPSEANLVELTAVADDMRKERPALTASQQAAGLSDLALM